MSDEYETTGRKWFRGAVSASALDACGAALKFCGRPGIRLAPNCLPHLLLDKLDGLAQTLLPGARPVRVVGFDKNEAGNWALPWHQDRVIALQSRAHVPGFENWSRKSGWWHAEPPIKLLEKMLFARIHLDSSTPENGCLQIALASHARGRVSVSEAADIAGASRIEDCVAEPGDVLFAKALILHQSSSSSVAQTRRALRIDYCADALPQPLVWAA
jgi:hypothetical protein